jgi:hypothetical protein
MKFVDKCVFKEERFSVGEEVESGRCYISIPVRNPYVEYEEYYEIDRSQYEACPANVDELRDLAEKCRARHNDQKLIMQPGRLRGDPM